MSKTSFVDHVARTGIPNAGPKLKGVTNSEEWGARVAVERAYGSAVRTFPPPEMPFCAFRPLRRADSLPI